MIGKVVAKRSETRSSFARLADYIRSNKNQVERVEWVRVSQCENSDPKWAIREIEGTQKLNVRATGDKTYHLLLSFAAGERPSDDALRAIEDRVVAALGFSEHQRISAVHNDTDNLHIHIAINKVHPTRLSMHSPLRDFQTIASTCAQLEREFGLVVTNHEKQQTAAQGRAKDMEAIRGEESLIGFLRRECAPQLAAATSWADVHRIVGQHGVQLKLRGAGLAFLADNGVATRASSVDRALSIKSLQDRLGTYEEAAERVGRVAGRGYDRGPAGHYVQRQALYRQYQEDRVLRREAQSRHLTTSRADVRKEIEAAKKRANRSRRWLRAVGPKGVMGRIMRHQINRTLDREIRAALDRARQQRQVIYKHAAAPAWQDWLRSQAAAGNVEALAALRSRTARSAYSGAGIGVDAAVPPRPHVPHRGERTSHVSASGTVWRAVNAGVKVRDDGQRLRLRESVDDQELASTIRVAIAGYGLKLDVQGTEEFRKRVVRLTQSIDRRVRFTDARLEAHRATLPRSGFDERSQRSYFARAGAVFGFGSAVADVLGFGRGAVPTFADTRKPADRSAPQAPDRVHAVPDRDLVRDAQPSGVPLPPAVPNSVEPVRPARNPVVRRDDSGGAGAGGRSGGAGVSGTPAARPPRRPRR